MTLLAAGQLKAGSVLTETLTGARTLSFVEIHKYSILSLDPGGSARDVTLPPASAALDGMCIFLENTADAAEVITVKDAATAICTPTQNETAILYCRAGVWKGIVGASN